MNASQVAIATMTLARDAGEETLLLSALKALAGCGIPVFATDGGSSDAFMDGARRISGITFCTSSRAGLWPQIRASLQAARASGAPFVLYTEPDKHDFFDGKLSAFISETRADERTGVVLVQRSPELMATFPAFQQYTESVINRCCAEVIGEPHDYSYGPFLLRSTLVEHLEPPRDDLGWGWRPYTFGVAHRLGLEVRAAPYACACPQADRSEPEKIHRMQQLAQSVSGLVLSTKGRPSSVQTTS